VRADIVAGGDAISVIVVTPAFVVVGTGTLT
jgi:hypothetical protein